MDAPSAGDATPALDDHGSLDAQLRERTIKGTLFVPVPRSEQVKCTACAHRCVLDEGRVGACGVRFLREGELRVPYGYISRSYVRSVETNTIFHVRPGSLALTFGMFGCDLRCAYCHNWQVSQALREGGPSSRPIDVSADELVSRALASGARVVCSAYNEPMISAEWAHAVFSRAREAGLATALISDGNTTPEALAYMRDVTDVFRVDLKSYDNEQYHALGGRLAPVLSGIREARQLGYWVEVVTLVVPGFNDEMKGLRNLAQTLVEIDPGIPWHLNAFYPRYKLRERTRTPGLGLMEAAGMAYARGLKFVYVSNLADEVTELSHTRCPACHEVVIERANYRTGYVGVRDGRCPACSVELPGHW